MHVEDIAVSDEEVNEAYERSRERFPGALEPEAKYRVRRSLEDNRRADALLRLLERLRREATVTNYLLSGVAADLTSGEAPALGNPGAPVTVVEFCDFECPFCRKAQPMIRDALAKWDGKARLVFRHFPLPRHANAFEAARATVCAERQGRFWQLQEKLFEEGRDLSEDSLAKLAELSGLDPAAFGQCLKDGTVTSRVRRDVELGRNSGVNGTPAIFVNGRRITDVSQLSATIEAVLQETRPSAGAHSER